MSNLIPKSGQPVSGALSDLLSSLNKIEKGDISSGDMLCRMLMIEGSPAWREKGISSTLDEAQQEHPDPNAVLSVDRSVYLHIAKKGLSEASSGNNHGTENAREALEKAFKLATGSLKNQTALQLADMLPNQLPRLG